MTRKEANKLLDLVRAGGRPRAFWVREALRATGDLPSAAQRPGRCSGVGVPVHKRVAA